LGLFLTKGRELRQGGGIWYAWGCYGCSPSDSLSFAPIYSSTGIQINKEIKNGAFSL
jgi:hypothetical protein